MDPSTHQHLGLLQKRATPKLIILDADYRIASCQDGAREFFTSFGPLEQAPPDRLPHIVERAVRRAAESWANIESTMPTAIAIPLPELLVRATPLRGPAGHCIAVSIERIATRESLEGVAERFKLSAREIGILRMLLCGSSLKEIASALHLSQNTIKEHVKRIYAKIGANNRAEAIARVLDWRDAGTPLIAVSA